MLNYKKSLIIMIKSHFLTIKKLYIQIKNNMKKTSKIKISVSLSPHILKLLDDKTSNRSNYLDHILLEYFNKNNLDTSKIKL